MKRAILVLSSVLALAVSASAQSTFYPGFYLTLKGGAAETVGETKFTNLISPNAAIDLGYQITPVFGVRADISGWQGKGWYEQLNEGYKFNYGQVAADLTLDICNMFGFKERVINPYIFLGAGAAVRMNNGADKAKLPTDNYYWDGTKVGAVGRVGAGIDFRLGDLVALELEVVENAHSDKFNSKVGDVFDHQIAALAGLKFNFGAANGKKVAAEAAAAAATAAAAQAEQARLAAEKAAAEKAAAEKAAAEKLAAEKAAAEKAAREAAAKAEADRIAAEKAAAEAAKAQAAQDAIEAAKNSNNNVYYLIGKSDIRPAEMTKIKKVIKKLQANPDASVVVCGFADKYTGESNGNLTLSENRAQGVADAIVAAGIDPSRVKAYWYGDTIQVSKVAEKNRVSVMVVK